MIHYNEVAIGGPIWALPDPTPEYGLAAILRINFLEGVGTELLNAVNTYIHQLFRYVPANQRNEFISTIQRYLFGISQPITLNDNHTAPGEIYLRLIWGGVESLQDIEVLRAVDYYEYQWRIICFRNFLHIPQINDAIQHLFDVSDDMLEILRTRYLHR